jgi:DNA-binding transcriptional ArsR family regulator
VSEELPVEEVLSLLDDEYARAILIATSTEPMSANQLAEACDASLPTVYRRINRLTDHDLLAEHTELDEDGHHYSSYEATLESVAIDLTDGELTADVSREPTDAADRFTELWEGI